MRHCPAKWLWLIVGLCLLSAPACAEETSSGSISPDELWQKSRDVATGAWQDMRSWFGDGTEENDGFQRLWKDIVPTLEQTLTLEDRHETLPEDAWFGEDQVANREAIDELLDEAVAILSVAPAQRYRERIRELEERIQIAREEIAEYRTRRIAAPKDALWEKTIAEYDEAIDQRQAQIESHLAELEAIKRQFAEELQGFGLELDDEQLAFLLSTVIGDDLIDMGIAFDNVKTLTIQLEQLMVSSDEELSSGRRYYGMYLVLLQVLERMHSRLMTAINERYLPQIDAIIQKTQALTEETRALQQKTTGNRAVLAANLEAQALTLRAADFYREYLIDQAREVSAARSRLREDIAVAENTYETVKVSGELVALMRSSQRLLDDLLKRQVPPLRPFGNLEMKREFEKLTAQLRSGEAA